MSVGRFATGLGALAVALTGCGGEPSEAASEEDSAAIVDHCTNPLANSPTTVNAQELAFCQAEALGKIAGWVQEETLNGTLTSVSRVNIDPLAVEIQPYTQSGSPGSRAILVHGNTFVERDGHWVQATIDSDDDALAYQATLPMRFEALLNADIRAAGTDPTLSYQVLGRQTVNGHEVTVLSLELTDAEGDDRRTSKLYVRDDYTVVQSESSFRVNGSNQVRASTLTVIDEPQDIINPRFESDAEQ